MVDTMTAQALHAAMTAVHEGKPERARSLAESALAAGGNAPALNAFLGMVLTRTGETAAAVRHLAAAHLDRPNDTIIACNLIAAQIDLGDLEGALEVASFERALADPSLRLARYRGFLSQSLERFSDAAMAYRLVVERAPDDFESWNNLGNALAALGDANGSVDALQRAVTLAPAAAPMRLNLAAALRAAGRSTHAEDVLRRAVGDFPDDARAWFALHSLFDAQDRREESYEAVIRAARLDKANAVYQLALGVAAGEVGNTETAETALRAAIALEPAFGDAYLGLAVHFEHSNQAEQFAALIAQGVANGVEVGVLDFIRALDCNRSGQAEQGLQLLAGLPQSIEPQRSAYLKGQFLDQLGRTDEAFSAFATANELHAEDVSKPLERAAAYRAEIAAEISMLTQMQPRTWAVEGAIGSERDPVFLVGFPRSGTTLLDTFLMGHPETTVMEEKPALNRVEALIGGMARLSQMSIADADAARGRYFEEVRVMGASSPGRLLIDKSPLFLMKLPLIRRLFPRARIILAIRHPCDVVLSCLMSNFRLNTAMSNFLRMEDAAQFYDLAFRHWEASQNLFELPVHIITYERLVADPAAELRPLFDFLQLDWREDALDHVATAKRRGLITTASYAQVSEPVYTRAAGRWERYRRHIEPVIPLLDPWVKKFGYGV